MALRMTEEQFQSLQIYKRQSDQNRKMKATTSQIEEQFQSLREGKNAKSRNFALGRLKTGERNKTEQAYENHLADRQKAGDVLWFKFEGVKLRLADNTFYTPDFAVMLANGQIEMHEVKGYWIDDARVKIKVAAEMYPFRFLAAREKPKKDGGGWQIEVFE